MLAKRPIHVNYNNKKCVPPQLPPTALSVLTFLACCSADGGHAGCGPQLFQNLRGHWLEEVQDLVLQGHKLQVGPQGLEALKLWVGLQCTSVTLTSVRVAGKSLWPSTSKCPGFSLQSTLIALTFVTVAAKSLWSAAWRDPGSRPVRACNVLQSY